MSRKHWKRLSNSLRKLKNIKMNFTLKTQAPALNLDRKQHKKQGNIRIILFFVIVNKLHKYYQNQFIIFQKIRLVIQIFLIYKEKQMQKSSSSTSQSSFQNSRSNEAHLMQLAKNLQLQLGYHAIALKKAEQMIKLLQNENKVLSNQNQMLRSKCQELQFRIVKYENQLSAMSQASSGMDYMECISPGLQRKKYPHTSSQVNIQPDKITSYRSISKYSNKPTLEPETPNRKKYNPLFKSNQFIEVPINKYMENQIQLPSPMKKKKTQSKISKSNGLSCKFIPFEQLQLNVNWK